MGESTLEASALAEARVTNSGVRTKVLENIGHLVVKLGTGVLTDAKKQPDLAQMKQLVAQVAAQRKAGREVVLVSSPARSSCRKAG